MSSATASLLVAGATVTRWRPKENGRERGKESSERTRTLGSKSGRQKRAGGHRKPKACRARPSCPFSLLKKGGGQGEKRSGKSLPGQGKLGVM